MCSSFIANIMSEKVKKDNLLFKLGLALIVLAGLLLLAIFFPVIKNELKYFFSDKSGDVKIILQKQNDVQDNVQEGTVPADENFSLIIPKISVNARVIENVDPINEREYRAKLKEGVAHAKGSGLPNDDQTIFIFAHSSENFYESDQYNSIFYLLRKLESGDKFHIVYEGEIYDYEVLQRGVAQSETDDFLQDNDKYDIILMTCWPPGTDFKRLLVFGRRI